MTELKQSRSHYNYKGRVIAPKTFYVFFTLGSKFGGKYVLLNASSIGDATTSARLKYGGDIVANVMSESVGENWSKAFGYEELKQ